KGKIALEIDGEKVNDYLKGTTTYWKDIFEISEGYSKYNAWISISLEDGAGTVTINTKWITGSNKMIFNTMLDYFEKAKRHIGAARL
ncbi:MAG: hypothetical protein JSU01_03055, partial [Bacteroidetes bacterium]|nr:hypothetical protein [Bacteroidota bacterium]